MDQRLGMPPTPSYKITTGSTSFGRNGANEKVLMTTMTKMTLTEGDTHIVATRHFAASLQAYIAPTLTRKSSNSGCSGRRVGDACVRKRRAARRQVPLSVDQTAKAVDFISRANF